MARFSDSSRSLVIIAFVLAIAALYFGRQVLIPLALGLVFSFVLFPFVSQLEKLRLGRVTSVFIVLALAFALVGALSWGVAGQLVEVMAHVSDYKSNLDAKIQALHAEKDGNLSKAAATVKELNKELGEVPGQIAANQPQNKQIGSSRPVHPIPVQVAAPPSNFLQDLRALLGPLAGVLETAVIVIIFTVFMLLKREDLRDRAIRLAGKGQLSLMTQALDDAGQRLSRYLLLQFVVNAGYGLLFGAGLYFIRIPHAFLWGVLASLLRFIPYIGTLAAAAFPILMSLAMFPGWRHAALAFGLFVILEIVVSNFVEPTLYGVHTGISSLAILVAAIFWTMLWGPVGLILSTPLTVCLVVLGRYVPHLSFLEIVLGDEPVLTPAQRFYQRLLAADQEEATAIAIAHLKDNSLVSVYDSILIPALRLAEQDHRINGLDEDSKRFVLRSTRELIEDLGDQIEEGSLPEPAKEDAEVNSDAVPHDREVRNDGQLARNQPVRNQLVRNQLVRNQNDRNQNDRQKDVLDKPIRARHSSLLGSRTNQRIACIPSTAGADDLVALMLTQLLQRAGYPARQLRDAPLEEMLAANHNYDIVCISSLLPFAIAQTRTLCRRLQSARPDSQVIVGLWDFAGGPEKARERLGTNCPAAVTTTLSDALEQIRQLTDHSVARAPSPANADMETEPDVHPSQTSKP